ncbi:unnamed protein product [Ectocarpus sp. CCAP 1310/34]|nr:unnamed protein product [Ectocarpus sp. CCAP 1310/34]
MENYERGEKLGEGAWGVVTSATQKATGRVVAIKKIAMKLGKYTEGANFTALREIKLLQELKHDHIIELVDVFLIHEDLNLVFEFCETDLESILMEQSVILKPEHVKCHMKMLLEGLGYLHDNFVLHRDLKPNNLLYASDGKLKLADFGLARSYGSPGRHMTPTVVTRWYRPPELCFGCHEYGSAVDMWGVGCIFAELMCRRPLFPGVSDVDQVARIFQVMGTPTDESWPEHCALPDYVEFKPQPPVDLSSLLSAASPDAMDLLLRLLVLRPDKRATAREALRHPYFTKHEPKPCEPSELALPIPEERKNKVAKADVATFD